MNGSDGAARVVRTDAEPMAFSAVEFAQGAVVSWLFYLGLGLLCNAALLPYAVFVFVPVSIVVLIVGSVPAWFLGRGLRRFRDRRIHHLAFALLGLVLSFVAYTVTLALSSGGNPWAWSNGLPLIITGMLNVASGTLAIWGGWCTASRAAHFGGPHGVKPLDVTPDAAPPS